MITLPFDCASQDGDLWLYAARDALASVLESGGGAEQRDEMTGGGGGDDVGSRVSALLAGGTGEMLDAKTAVYSTLPLLVGIVFIIVFVILAVAFRSLLVPIRAVLSIALTMGWVFGFATSVYQARAEVPLSKFSDPHPAHIARRRRRTDYSRGLASRVSPSRPTASRGFCPSFRSRAWLGSASTTTSFFSRAYTCAPCSRHTNCE